MKPQLTATTPISIEVNGLIIRVYVLESGAFRTEVQYLGGPLVDELSRSYASEVEARGHARTVTRLLTAGWSVQRLIELVDLFNQTPPAGAPQTVGRRELCEGDHR